MTNPVTNPELYDKYTLGDVRSPGVVTFSGLARKNKWDIKEGDGQDGASTTRKGKTPLQFTASHYLVLDPTDGTDEFAEWDAFLPTLESTSGGKDAQALAFYHPDVARLKCGAVVVESIGALQHDGLGGANVVVGYLEYSPPKPKSSSSPSGAKTSPPWKGNYESETVPPDPLAQSKAELEALYNEAKKPF